MCPCARIYVVMTGLQRRVGSKCHSWGRFSIHVSTLNEVLQSLRDICSVRNVFSFYERVLQILSYKLCLHQSITNMLLLL